MKKITKIILIVASVLLVAALATVLYLGYFVQQWSIFDRSGWFTTVGGSVQYRDYFAKPLTGWQTIEGNRYYFSSDGTMQTGWLEQDGKRYYLTQEGTPHSGWLEQDGTRYYLTQEGTPYSGWLEQDGKRYYLDNNGKIQSGWATVEEESYYFSSDGAMYTGWLELEDGTRLLDAQGHPVTGWTEQEGVRYYFNDEGIQDKAWQNTEKGLSYVQDGNAHVGWLNVPAGKFYFNEDGISQKGWITDETGRFYLYGDGTFATGFVEIDGIERYFLPTGEYILLCNRWNPIPDDYKMQLVKVGKHKLDASCVEPMDRMFKAAKEDGITLKFNSTYRSKGVQQYMWNVRREKYMAQGMTRAQANEYIGRSVAVPGTSEHQTGLAADITGSQKLYDWLAQNSWKFGFILRYPSGKKSVTGIIHEPWHFRYVGEALAKDIYESGLCLEEYLEHLKSKQQEMPKAS